MKWAKYVLISWRTSAELPDKMYSIGCMNSPSTYGIMRGNSLIDSVVKMPTLLSSLGLRAGTARPTGPHRPLASDDNLISPANSTSSSSTLIVIKRVLGSTCTRPCEWGMENPDVLDLGPIFLRTKRLARTLISSS